jgi:hypothetical protein
MVPKYYKRIFFQISCSIKIKINQNYPTFNFPSDLKNLIHKLIKLITTKIPQEIKIVSTTFKKCKFANIQIILIRTRIWTEFFFN